MRAENRLAQAAWQGKEGLALAGKPGARPEPMLAAPLEVGPEQPWQDRGLEALGRLDPQESLDRARFLTDGEHAGLGIESFPKRAALGHLPQVPAWGWPDLWRSWGLGRSWGRHRGRHSEVRPAQSIRRSAGRAWEGGPWLAGNLGRTFRTGELGAGLASI
jgi:hypothetical protein